ncbi:helicase-associated domain-containing protein [Streptomyces sp. NPDC058751]|uniref:helicase-associated domain-containing protein n=1 Tax=Streptomyces sp. NPDC058751 TaxID=3346623 RepID=UPI00369E826F
MSRSSGISSVAALEQWLAGLAPERLTTVLEERELPRAAGYERITGFGVLAAHLLTDPSVAAGMLSLDAAHWDLLEAVGTRAIERYGPPRRSPAQNTHVPMNTYPPFGDGDERNGVIDPYDRLVPESDLLNWLQMGGTSRSWARSGLARLREHALLLPAPDGQLAVPARVHRLAAGQVHGRRVDELLTGAFNAPEVRRIAAALGLGDKLSRGAAQEGITDVLGDPGRVRALVEQAPQEAHDLLERLVPGPPLMHTHCFVSRYEAMDATGIASNAYGRTRQWHPGDKFTFRDGGSGDAGTDWLAARGMVVPVGPDLVELCYEVGRALRGPQPSPTMRTTPPPLTATRALPSSWQDEGGTAAGAAAWRAELVLRELATAPVAIRKTGGIAVRETRRLAKAAGASEADTRLWLDLAVNAGLAAPEADEEAPAARGRGRRTTSRTKPSARLLPTHAYDTWARAAPAGKLLPLVAAWAVVPEVLTCWPDADEPPVALIAPSDGYAVPLRRGLLAALASLPDGHGTLATEEARCALLERAAWFQPALYDLMTAPAEPDAPDADRPYDAGDLLAGLDLDHLAHDDTGDDHDGTDVLLQRLRATLDEAELLGLVAHGALTDAGRAVHALLEAGAHRHYPAVPGAHADPAGEGTGAAAVGADLAGHPHLAAAAAGLRDSLRATLPAPSTTARFQADSTATVTGAPATELAELLTDVGDIESEGHAVVWRITPASLRRALDTGWSADDILERLQAVCANGTRLPQPLTYTIKDTARTHGRLRVVRSACCIRSDDTVLITEITRAKSLAALALRRIAPTVAISTAPPETTLSALRKAGYAPVLETETGTTVIERAPADRATSTVPALDQAHPQYGQRTKGLPSSAAELTQQLIKAKARS